MGKIAKKTTKRKRTTLKDLPATPKEVSKKGGKRIKGGLGVAPLNTAGSPLNTANSPQVTVSVPQIRRSPR